MTEQRAAREHVHLLGIGGTGMSALAGLLDASGVRVTGSDRRLYPPTSTILARLGVEVHEGFAPEHLDPAPDLVVVGNAMSRGNPEVEEVLDRRLPYVSMPRLIEERFLPGRHSVVVAGTHGKTTTTSMLAWVLRRAGRDPGFLIGGAPVDFEFPFHLGAGAPFVLEGDEYDTAFFDKGPKFMHYRPDTALLGAVEFDHADIYLDLDQVTTAFRRFVQLVPRRGILVYHADPATTRDIAAGAPSRRASYGFSAEATWRAESYAEGPAGARCRVRRDGEPFADIELRVPGRHNLLNALATLVAADDLGLSRDDILDGLATFGGVRRRLELAGRAAGVTVLDDFAHHPTAIAASLGAARASHPGRRIWAVLEPRSWSLRRNVFQDRLAEAFDAADRVVIAEVYGAGSLEPAERLDPARLAAAIAERGRDAEFLPGTDAILDRLTTALRSGDVVVVMSNGGFDGLPRRLVEALERRPAAATGA
jgi:UDP-N-acetylmuramate: L-alanyl-gamma-D-glutamyl-meso-diaminopimelate ligase